MAKQDCFSGRLTSCRLSVLEVGGLHLLRCAHPLLGSQPKDYSGLLIVYGLPARPTAFASDSTGVSHCYVCGCKNMVLMRAASVRGGRQGPGQAGDTETLTAIRLIPLQHGVCL